MVGCVAGGSPKLLVPFNPGGTKGSLQNLQRLARRLRPPILPCARSLTVPTLEPNFDHLDLDPESSKSMNPLEPAQEPAASRRAAELGGKEDARVVMASCSKSASNLSSAAPTLRLPGLSCGSLKSLAAARRLSEQWLAATPWKG